MARLVRHGINAALLAAMSVGITWAAWLALRPTMVIPWPAAVRSEGDHLLVDGHSLPMPAVGSEVKVRVATGTHRVHLSRTGYEPVELETERLRLGESLRLSPEWKLNSQGVTREKLKSITEEVSDLRFQPAFRQRNAVVRLNQLTTELTATEDAPSYMEKVGSLRAQLRAPMTRPVLAQATSEPQGHPEPFLLSLGSNKLRHSGSITVVRFCLSGQLVASGGLDGRVSVHDVSSGNRIYDSDAHEGAISDLRFVSDNQFVSIDRTGLACITTISERQTKELMRANGELTAVAVLDERRIATGGSGTRIWILNTETLQKDAIETSSAVAHILAGSSTDLIAISPDGLVTVFKNLKERLTFRGRPPQFACIERQSESHRWQYTKSRTRGISLLESQWPSSRRCPG